MQDYKEKFGKIVDEPKDELVGMSLKNGDIFVMCPLYRKPTGTSFFYQDGFEIIVFADKQEPLAWLIEHAQGSVVVGPGISDLIEILGEL